jgi:hypothetical protein
MTSYIHFEEDALGDDEILGETDMDYFIEPKDSYLADSKQFAGREDKEIQQTHKPQRKEANDSVTTTNNSTRGNRKPETLSEDLEHHETLAEHHEAHETLAECLESLADPKSPKRPRQLGDRDNMRTPNDNEGATSYIPPDIRGEHVIMKDGRSLHEHLKEVCLYVKPVFNTKVRSTPALVTPMRLEVQDHLWEDPSNALGPRLHTPLKQAEVAKQVNKMKPLGIIKDSQAPYYSQVHLTPKPTPGEWRFCIDYRRLNVATKSMGWPLPNISDMLRRLGSRKPKWFCKLDLTAGYHQTPLHEKSWKYTAFKTAFGVFEWKRVPMGLKGAPSYFQHVMQSEVLHGLMYLICELYIDDVIIFAETEEQMVVI